MLLSPARGTRRLGCGGRNPGRSRRPQTAAAHRSRHGSDRRAVSRIAVWTISRTRAGAVPLGDVLQDLTVQEFRAHSHLRTVSGDASVFASAYWLEIEVTDFQAEYASAAALPTVHVHLLARIGNAGDRHILGQFEADVAATGRGKSLERHCRCLCPRRRHGVYRDCRPCRREPGQGFRNSIGPWPLQIDSASNPRPTHRSCPPSLPRRPKSWRNSPPRRARSRRAPACAVPRPPRD